MLAHYLRLTSDLLLDPSPAEASLVVFPLRRPAPRARSPRPVPEPMRIARLDLRGIRSRLEGADAA